jgi:hypothetical protein
MLYTFEVTAYIYIPNFLLKQIKIMSVYGKMLNEICYFFEKVNSTKKKISLYMANPHTKDIVFYCKEFTKQHNSRPD